MDLIAKYQELKKKLNSIAMECNTETNLLVDIENFEGLLIENLKKIEDKYKKYKMLYENADDFKEQALFESEVKLKQIIEQITDGIIIYDKNGKIIIWNSGAEIITGIKAEDALKRKITDIQYQVLHGEHKDKDLIDQKFNEVITMSNPEIFNFIFENEIYLRNKGVRFIQCIVFPITYDSKYSVFGSVIRDITNIKRVENQLRELIATKDKIISIIAHDLRSPFNSLIGITDLMLENFDNLNVETLKVMIKQINSSAIPALAVLDNLLDWAKIQTGQMKYKPENFRLSPVLEELVDIMNSSAKIKKISINQFQSSEIVIYADQNLLKSVLRNLVSNAIKYTPFNGKIEIYAIQNPDHIEITVSDNGIGMNEEMQNTLFTVGSAVTTIGTEGEKGSGIGLMLCKEFVEKHGGRIWVRSKTGKGSEFKFSIPLRSKILNELI
jgi:two-component system, sensor histidine kinase and response regulator